MTPNEIQCLINGYYKKKEEKIKDNYHLAWHIAAFVGSLFDGKLPDLNALMIEKIFDNEDSNEENEDKRLLVIMQSLQNRLGKDMIKIEDC